MTFKCVDHIVGIHYEPYEGGEVVLEGEGLENEDGFEPFNFCPICGTDLEDK